MTEEEWLTGSDAQQLLNSLNGQASDRKLRLFAVACCRIVWQHFTHERSRQAVVVAELYADGLVGEAELTRAFSMANDAIARWEVVTYGSRVMIQIDRTSLPYLRMRHATAASHTNKPFFIGRLRGYGRDPELSGGTTTIIRDIFGNPFRPVAFDPVWRTPTTIGIASAVYADRAFERTPILADALEEAGCDNANILTHCREPGAHVRGCWVVDLVLGKE